MNKKKKVSKRRKNHVFKLSQAIKYRFKCQIEILKAEL
jgi:hypothetical protein